MGIPKEVRTALDEIANALQAAIGQAAAVRRDAHATADAAVQLEGSIARAVTALKRLQPRLAPEKPR